MQYLQALVAAHPYVGLVFAAWILFGLGLIAVWTNEIVNRPRVAKAVRK